MSDGETLRARLLCRTGKLAGATYELGTDSTIGRDQTSDVVLVAETVSGRHARIYLEDGAYFLEDLGSSNGTQLDGRTVTEAVKLDALNVITFSGSFDVIFQTMTALPTTPVIPDEPAPPPHQTDSRTRVDLEAFAPLPELKEAALAPPVAYYLKVTVRGQPSIEFRLDTGTHTVGRSEDCDVTVNHESLSRTHATVTIGEEGLSVKDMGSTNGTFVDGRNVSDSPLSPSQQFKLGSDITVEIQER